LTEPPVNPFKVGDWLRWTIQNQIKEGQVVVKSGTSIVVRWLGGGDQVFPVVEGYIPPRGHGLELIPEPKGAKQIQRDTKAGRMTVKRAAALLGVEPKRVRSMLRRGAIKGYQRDGRWVECDSESVLKIVDHG
jgi:hypothetical protein